MERGCGVCKYQNRLGGPGCDEPKAPHALTREQAITLERGGQGAVGIALHLCQALATLQATLAARERDIDKLKADLNEMWVDDKGTVWTKPTAWAYAMVCKAGDKHAHDAARLREAAHNLTCEVCKLDMQRALKGA